MVLPRAYAAGSEDFLIEVAKGKVPGHSIVHKFGRNNVVANGVWEHVSLLSGATTFLSAATTVRIKAGGNVADTAAGAGAREVTVQGIDNNLVEITETIATAGASASSATTALFWRIHRTWVSGVGTYGVGNTGPIIVEASGGGDLIMIAATEGQSQFAGFTIPIGKTGHYLGTHIMVDSLKPADMKFLQRRNFNDITAPMSSLRLVNYFDGVAGHMTFMPRTPMIFPALTDIWWEAEGSGAQSEVSVDFELLLVDD